MRRFVWLLSLALSCMASCTNKEEGAFASENEDVNERNVAMYVDRLPNDISLADANKIASLFYSGSNSTRKSESMDIQTVVDEDSNVPLLYIVNYGQNKGYVIISASKNTTPILAYSDVGRFLINEKNYSSSFLDGCKKNVRYAQLCKSDSLRIKYALQWASFEKEDAAAISRSFSPDMQQKKEKEIEYREAQGYKYIGGLTAARYYMDDNGYKTFVSEMESCSDPQYDYTETVQLFVKTVTQESVGELLQTHWHQSYPFNVDAPNGFAGCVPIAVAQIAYYHKYPNKYDWSKIAVMPTMNDAFSFFIKDIRNLCDVKYNPDGTASNYEKARSAFDKLGYTVKKAGTPTCDKLRGQILARDPVYMQGLNSNSEGHAWVCDGYKNLRNLCIATLIPNPKDPRFRVEEKSPNGFMAYGLYLNAYPSDAGEYLHVNLGWGGDSDGWYYRYMYVSDTPEHYKNKQLMLTVKK